MRAMLMLTFALVSCNSEPSETDRTETGYDARADQLLAEARAIEDSKAQTGEDTGSISKAALNEQIATVLNLNGLLCASVVGVRPLAVGANTYEVTCIEYRGGAGQVRYVMDAAKGTAFKGG